MVLERAGVRTTLLCRTREQAERLAESRENERYLKGVRLPDRLKVRALGARDDQFHRADLVFLAVPSAGIDDAIAELSRQGVSPGAGVVSLTKGLVPPDGTPPTVALERAFGADRVACVALSLAFTGGLLRLLRAAHPPAGATTVIVSIGLLTTVSELAILLAGVLLLSAAAWSLNRALGVPAPAWTGSK